jgi:anti-sigma factor RsiW
MDNNAELKLQAYLDGELPESEAREVAKSLAQDQEAVLLLAELRNTRQALVGFEKGVTLPESREFFWSKVEREISRLEPAPRTVEKVSLLATWRRLLVPAGAVAALLTVVFIAIGPFGAGTSAQTDVVTDESGAFTYRDEAAQATLIWVTYPAENEVADSRSGSNLK